MATLTTTPDFSTTMPGLSSRGYALLNSLTAGTIWAETSLQYYFGNAATLAVDAEFKADYRYFFGKATPDSEFYFEDLASRAFQIIGTVSNLAFSETTDLLQADQVLVSTDAPKKPWEGFFEFPGTSFHDEAPDTDSWSLGTLNSGLKVMTKRPAFDGDGEYANWTVLHEIGHSLGLKHTHKEKSGLPPLDTVGRFMDNERYSVMSYNGSATALAFGHAVSFMALDIASLQALYGARDYATGASAYSLMNAGGGALDLSEGAVAIGRAYYCIWDSGGEDAINYAGTGKSVLVNLNDATLDTKAISDDLQALIAQLKNTFFFKHLASNLQDEITDAWHHAGGFFSRVLNRADGDYKGVAGGYSIAHGAEIENASGGDKADLLIGNEGDNVLSGLAGNDALLGGSGADMLDGGEGADRLDGGYGTDTLAGGAGADRFVFATGYGEDTVTDFEAGDVIDLTRLTGVIDFADLQVQMTEENGNVVIIVGADSLVIENVTKADLDEGDFQL
jgi:Ca2+-binding RTX toxin-like protein